MVFTCVCRYFVAYVGFQDEAYISIVCINGCLGGGHVNLNAKERWSEYEAL